MTFISMRWLILFLLFAQGIPVYSNNSMFSEEEAAILLNSAETYVYFGAELSSITDDLPILSDLAHTAQLNTPNLDALAMIASRGYTTAPAYVVAAALQEAIACVEHCSDEESLRIAQDLARYHELFESGKATITVITEDGDEPTRGTKRFDSIVVHNQLASGQLYVYGDAVINHNLTVNGDEIVNGNVIHNGSEIILGDLTVSGTGRTCHIVVGDILVDPTICPATSGSVTLANGDVNLLNGNTNVSNGDLNLLNGNINQNGDINLIGDINQSGDFVLTGNLSATGVTTINTTGSAATTIATGAGSLTLGNATGNIFFPTNLGSNTPGNYFLAIDASSGELKLDSGNVTPGVILNGGQVGPLTIGTVHNTGLAFVTTGSNVSRLTIDTSGNVAVTNGNFAVNGNSAISGNEAIGNNLAIGGNEALGGNLVVGGSITGNSLTVTTTATICDLNVTCGATINNATFNNVVVTGTATAGSLVSNSSITGNSLAITNGAIVGNLTTTGNITGGSLNVGGTTQTNNLVVTGTTTTGALTSNSSITGNSLAITNRASVGSLTATGSITGNSLTVTTTATICSLNVTCGAIITTPTAVVNGTLKVHNGNILLSNANTSATQGILQLGVDPIYLYNAGTSNFFAGDYTAGVNATVAGSDNIALGRNALSAVTTGSANIAIGCNANATITTVSNTIAIGTGAKALFADTIAIGDNALANSSNTLVIGSADSLFGGAAPQATGNNSIVIGSASGTYAGPSGKSNAIIIGSSNGSLAGALGTGNTGCLVIGIGASVNGSNGLAIGNGDSTSTGATTTNGGDLAIGNGRGSRNGPSAQGGGGIALGGSSGHINGPSLGPNCFASIAIGEGAIADGATNIALGSVSTATAGLSSIAIGGAQPSAPGQTLTGAGAFGSYSIALGSATQDQNGAFANGSAAIAIGSGIFPGVKGSRAVGQAAIALGNNTSASGTNAIAIGTGATATAGQTVIANIRGVTTTLNDAVPVLISSAGQLGTTSSSKIFKENFRNLDEQSAHLYKLNPVLFDYKAEHGGHKDQIGLIAEEVALHLPELIAHDNEGNIYSVKYHLLPTLLLNELQHHQQRLDDQEQRHQQELEALKAELALLKTALHIAR